MAFIDFDGTQTPAPGGLFPAAPTSAPAAPSLPPMTPEGVNPPPQAPTVPFYQNDPGYLGAVSLRSQQLANAQALLAQLTKQADIRFGDYNNPGLDDATRALAKANYLSGNSTLSRLDKTHSLDLAAILNQQAAHGMLGSGDTGYRQGQENSAYGNNVYDARNQLLDYLTGQQQNYLQQKAQLDQYVQQALENAYNNYINNPALYSGASTGVSYAL